jgi:peptidoglycan glycosyltransferase
MNAPIARLFAVIVVMFALLIAWTSRWTVFEAKSLNDNPLNKRTLADEVRIKRGRLLADDGTTVLAYSKSAPGGTWRRIYPQGSLFSQAIGYSNVLEGEAAGLEQSRGAELRGLQTGLTAVFGQTSRRQVGDDVYTTLDPKAQEVARRDLAGRAGSVVAMNPKTGAIYVMYSNPSYNNNESPQVCVKTPGCSLLNGATQGLLPPGSTFKIVTATAAIDSGRYTPNSLVNGKSPIVVSGVPLSNDVGDPAFGLISLTEAFTLSVNTVFAQVAESLGIPTMTTYMKRFGFYSQAPLDYPPGQIGISAPHNFTNGRAFRPGSQDEDIGRIGIGQGGLQVSPLQMAMVTAAVANGGKLMTPRLTNYVVDSTGQKVETISPSVYSLVMKPSTADAVKQMMLKVVEEGTGTPAQLGGISVAGKTGTAQVGRQGSGLTEPWFVGLAPVSDPQVVVAATVYRTQGGYGATVAAPIARDVIQTLLSEGK